MENKKTTILVLCASTVYFIISFIFFYPGWMSFDSLYQYGNALNDKYSDWHPVLFAWWWRKLNFIFSGPATYLAQNLLFYWMGWALIAIGTINRIKIKSLIINLFGFFPGIFLMLGMIWKDISFGCSAFLAWAIIIFHKLQNKNLGLISNCAILFLSIFAVGVKTNGITAIPFLIYYATENQTARLNRASKIAITAVISCAIFIIPTIIVPSEKIIKTYNFQYTQTYDLLAIMKFTGLKTMPDYIYSKCSNIDTLKKLYSIESNDSFFNMPTPFGMASQNKVEIDELDKKWRNCIRNNFGTYLSHRWHHFLCMMRIGYSKPAYVVAIGIDQNQYGLNYKENIFTKLAFKMRDKLPIFYFPWTYSLLVLITGLVLFKKKEYRKISICILASVLGFLLPHFFIVPSHDFRYLYYVYICCLMLIALLVTSNNDLKNEK